MITVGVAGLGYWGPNVVRNFSASPRTQLAWLCDRDPERLGAVLDSDGPVFYRQIRIGRGRRPFSMWKFRTMVRDAPEDRHGDFVLALVRGSEPTRPASKLVDDPRITRVGRWLRRSSFDELPQLFNVVRGEMSLIGPRPPIVYEYEAYQPWQLERFEMPHGMTGLWQVSGRQRVTYRHMHELDIEYVRRWSLWLDVKILVATLRAVVVDGEPIG